MKSAEIQPKFLLRLEHPELTVSVDVNLIKHHVGNVLRRGLRGNSVDCTDGLEDHREEISVHQSASVHVKTLQTFSQRNLKGPFLENKRMMFAPVLAVLQTRAVV